MNKNIKSLVISVIALSGVMYLLGYDSGQRQSRRERQTYSDAFAVSDGEDCAAIIRYDHPRLGFVPQGPALQDLTLVVEDYFCDGNIDEITAFSYFDSGYLMETPVPLESISAVPNIDSIFEEVR